MPRTQNGRIVKNEPSRKGKSPQTGPAARTPTDASQLPNDHSSHMNSCVKQINNLQRRVDRMSPRSWDWEITSQTLQQLKRYTRQTYRIAGQDPDSAARTLRQILMSPHLRDANRYNLSDQDIDNLRKMPPVFEEGPVTSPLDANRDTWVCQMSFIAYHRKIPLPGEQVSHLLNLGTARTSRTSTQITSYLSQPALTKVFARSSRRLSMRTTAMRSARQAEIWTLRKLTLC